MPTKSKKKPQARKSIKPSRTCKLPTGLKGMTYEQLLGKGKQFWNSDEELDQFLAIIREIRKD